ncbi:MAG: aspartate aminotransferase family protein [Caldithrix sp.]|nr:MAG: aspartate aminotransferase family protein [Caldithrix sp.]
MNVIDVEGVEYLDFFAGILTTGIGHCHPDVVERVREQVGRLGHTSTLYITENQINVARELAEITPGKLKSCFFTNSGTEAIETAIMLAQQYTGRHEVITLRHAYSGRSTLATNLTAHSSWRPVSSTIAGIKHAISPYTYRSPFDPTEPNLGEKFADDILDVIETTTSGRPAAFIAETILGVGGYIVPPPGYFQRAAEIIRSCGGLFICDEVQAGFGRTGEKWFGIEHWNVEPDIMVMAKGIANGFPVGATITRPEIAAAWKAKTITTFGGNPITMAATQATLEVMKRENTPARSAERGRQLRAGLDALYAEHEWIGEVRGMGLMQALELVEDRKTKKPSPEKTKALLEAAKEEKLLIGIGGLNNNVIRMGPSMLVTEAEVDDALERLRRACER